MGPALEEFAFVVIPSRVEEITKVRKVIGDLSRLDGLGEEEVVGLEIAVGEALANAVCHGSPRGESDTVEVTYQHLPGQHIEVSIADHGRGFDLERWREREQVLTLGEGNRGILLIFALVDEVNYCKLDGGGRIHLRKYVNGHALGQPPPGSDARINSSRKSSSRLVAA